MKRSPDKEQLLAAVLSADPDSEFSANVLADTLRGVRRQRRVRQARRYGSALAVLLAAVLASRHFLRSGAKPELARLPQATNFQMVATQPLTAGQITESRRFSPDQQVTTATVNVIKTISGGFDEIGDDELIALAAPNVVALVRRGPHEAELVIVSSPPDDSASQQN